MSNPGIYYAADEARHAAQLRAARLKQIDEQHAAASRYFSNYEARADEIKDKQHVETIGFLLSVIKTLSE